MNCPGPVHVAVTISGISITTDKGNVVMQLRINVPSTARLDIVELEIATTGEGTVNRSQKSHKQM